MILLYPLLFTGTVGGGVLSALLYPIDLLKTRMQMRQELVSTNLSWYQMAYQKKAFSDIYAIIWHIAYREGFRVLAIGMGPMFLIGGVTTCFRVASYEYAYSSNFLSSQKNDVLMPRSVLFCGVSGVLNQLIMNPFNLMKTKLQYWSLCQSSPTTSNIRTMNILDLSRYIYNKFGMRGFGIGWVACIPRGFVASVAQLVSYQECKTTLEEVYFIKDSFASVPTSTSTSAPDEEELIHIYISALFSGIVATLMISPFDIILTRLHTQPYLLNRRGLYYQNFGDVCSKIIRHEGYQGFYKGLLFLFFKHGAMSAMGLIFWDCWKDRFSEMAKTTTGPVFLGENFIDHAFKMCNLFEF